MCNWCFCLALFVKRRKYLWTCVWVFTLEKFIQEFLDQSSGSMMFGQMTSLLLITWNVEDCQGKKSFDTFSHYKLWMYALCGALGFFVNFHNKSSLRYFLTSLFCLTYCCFLCLFKSCTYNSRCFGCYKRWLWSWGRSWQWKRRLFERTRHENLPC